jgi:hypothetical protein
MQRSAASEVRFRFLTLLLAGIPFHMVLTPGASLLQEWRTAWAWLCSGQHDGTSGSGSAAAAGCLREAPMLPSAGGGWCAVLVML